MRVAKSDVGSSIIAPAYVERMKLNPIYFLQN